MEEITITKKEFWTIAFPDGTKGRIYKPENLPLENYFEAITIMEKMKEAKTLAEQTKLVIEFVFACTQGIEREKFMREIDYTEALNIYNKIIENPKVIDDSKKKDI